ncbi:MAG: sigma-70 family RNA polymerase sigma factor [Chitinophagales bacterium]|nr:sigma-70 family RNA polymerase sigma factor [Hyphomicrobiales bacterium]
MTNEHPDPKTLRTARQAAREQRWSGLMARAQDGDRASYASLLNEVTPLLRTTVRRKWRSENDVEDIVQEILLSLHRFRHTYDPTRAFLPWMMTIASRRVADMARKNARKSAHEIGVELFPETISNPEANLEQHTSDDHAVLNYALDRLPEAQRRAVEMIKIEGLSFREAALRSEKSETALRVTVHRAMKIMRTILKKAT